MSEVTEADQLTAVDLLVKNGISPLRSSLVQALAGALAAERAPFLALADEFDAQVPWPHSWIGNRIREAAGVEK